MAKFIYLYRGRAPDLTPEQSAERMAAFGAWMEKVASALVDGGSPFGSSGSVRDDGTEGTTGDLIGYTIVEADDLAAAKALTDGLPFLSNSDGQCAVEIFELLPMSRLPVRTAWPRDGRRGRRRRPAGQLGPDLSRTRAGANARSSQSGCRPVRLVAPAPRRERDQRWGAVCRTRRAPSWPRKRGVDTTGSKCSCCRGNRSPTSLSLEVAQFGF